MAVFSDAGKSNIHGRGAQRLTHAMDNFAWITVAIQQVMLHDPGFRNQTLEKILAKAGRMSDRQPDVLVEVKHLDTPPVDVLRAGQRIEKIQLGRSGCDDDTGASAIEDRAAYRGGRLFGGGFAERALVFKDSYSHAAISFARVCACGRATLLGLIARVNSEAKRAFGRRWPMLERGQRRMREKNHKSRFRLILSTKQVTIGK